MEPKDIAEIAKYGSIFTAGALAGAYAGRIKGAASDVARALYARNLKSNIGHGIWLVYNEICCRGYGLINSLDLWKNRKPAEGLEQRISNVDIFDAKLPQKLGQEGVLAIMGLEEMDLEEKNQWRGGYDSIRREKRFGIRKEFGEEKFEILATKHQTTLYERMLAKISGAKNPEQKTQLHFIKGTYKAPIYMGIDIMQDEVAVKGNSIVICPKNLALLLGSLKIPDKELHKDIETASRVIGEIEENEVLRKKVLRELTHIDYDRQPRESCVEKILEAR